MMSNMIMMVERYSFQLGNLPCLKRLDGFVAKALLVTWNNIIMWCRTRVGTCAA